MSDPALFDSNHSSAINFAQTVDSFIDTELSHEATAGPFKHDPIPSRLQTSPLQTVDKDKTKRRFVLDLSFPPGRSVNDGVPKDNFIDIPFHLTLPRSAHCVNLILSTGPVSFMYKKDLKRTYRQIPVDPKDYMARQRTTTAIASTFKSQFNFACINYGTYSATS